MESPMLTLVVQDERNVLTRLQDGSEASSELILDKLHRDLIDLFRDWLSQDKITLQREFKVFGTLLYRTLFTGEIDRFFEKSLSDARNAGQRLRIQLSFTQKAAALASIPWEYLYKANTGFLATNMDLALSRYIPLVTDRRSLVTDRPNLAPRENLLRVLLVTSKPRDLDPVISDGVIEPIQKLAEGYPILVDVLNTPMLYDFLDKIEAFKPHVLHFIGHGRFNERKERDEIALLDSDGGSALWVGDDELLDCFVHMRSIPHLIFLHLDEGSIIDLGTNYAGLATQLVRAGVQAVVAMQYPISNDAAVIFSQAFYLELARGDPVDIAVQNGRWRITALIPKAYDSRIFGTPALFIRSSDIFWQ